jgi:hypothetical protein
LCCSIITACHEFLKFFLRNEVTHVVSLLRRTWKERKDRYYNKYRSLYSLIAEQ